MPMDPGDGTMVIKGSEIMKRFAVFTISVAVALVVPPRAKPAQKAAAPQSSAPASNPPSATNPADSSQNERWNTHSPPASYYENLKSGPAPKRDLSGIWDAGALEGGIQPNGAYAYPDDPEHAGHDVPYTPLGKQARMKNKPGSGVSGQFPAAEVNDPVDYCDPEGMPRNDLFELRVLELIQKANQLVILNQYNDTWRIIWTDGRELPSDPAPRWNGYATGKWFDDYTFVANYAGMDPRTWLDNVGRPHSDALRVEERWQRVNQDSLELTVTIDDPKFYAQPWKALDKFVLHRLPDDFDISEFICSATETAEYNRLVGKPVAPAAADSTNK